MRKTQRWDYYTNKRRQSEWRKQQAEKKKVSDYWESKDLRSARETARDWSSIYDD